MTKNIKAKTARLGLRLTETSVGDWRGRRYQFKKPKGAPLGFVFGLREAEVWLDGYAAAAQKDSPNA